MKPREWYFNVTWNGEYSCPIDKEPINVGGDDEIVKVIEKSAYDELLQAIREANVILASAQVKDFDAQTLVHTINKLKGLVE